MVRVLDVEAGQEELVCSAEGTEATVTSRVGVGQVATVVTDVSLEELLTSLSRGGRNRREFKRSTSDFPFTNGLTEETFNKVGVWREAVHPSPPAEQTEGLHNTIAAPKH